MKSTLRLFAMIINAIELLLFPDQFEEGPAVETRHITYYFMVQAKRFMRHVMSRQTRAVKIVVDSDKYTRIDAECFAAKEFMHLDDSWVIEIKPITLETYLHNKRLFAESIEDLIGSTDKITKTNS